MVTVSDDPDTQDGEKYSVPYMFGTTGYAATLAKVPAPNPYAAHLFLNFMLDPKNVGAAGDYIGYQPVVSAAMDYITNETQRAMRPSDEIIEAGALAEDVGEFQRNFDEAWREVVSA